MFQHKRQELYIGDNLPIMLGMDSGLVDLIYLDPPFKTNTLRKGKTKAHSFDDTWSKAEIDYAHAIRLQSTHPAMWKWIDLAQEMHGKPMHNYLAFMSPRLVQMHRLLKSSGSLYLHCDPTASHYLKPLLDVLFGNGENGKPGFRNEIIWFYHDTPGRPKMDFPRKHDTIFRFVKSARYIFNADSIRIPILPESVERYKTPRNLGGKKYVGGDSASIGKIPESVWQIPAVKGNSKERTGYDTQKPLALLDRIIKASSNEGDVVLDPFCGCATTCVAASGLHRQWIGIDQNKKAAEILRDRFTERLDTYTFETNYPTDAKLKKPLPEPKRSPSSYQKMAKPEAKKILLQGDYQEYGKPICKGCFQHRDPDVLDVDHILAKSKGGLDELENYQLLCRPCNIKKGNKPMQYLYDRIDEEISQKRANMVGDKSD